MDPPSLQGGRPYRKPQPHCWPAPLERHVHDDPFARRIPYPLRFRGGVFFEIIFSVTFIGALATALVLLKHYKIADLSVSTTLISVLGFIVSLSVSFRMSTAYERYIEGRKAWDTLKTAIRNIGRIIWLHVPHGKGNEGRDILAKKSALNLLLAYAIALKHHLREERGPYYDDLYPLICHLPRHIHRPDIKPPTPEELMEGGHIAHSSPISILKMRSFVHHEMKGKPREIPSSLYLHDRRDLSSQGTLLQGNIPLEIMNYISAFFELCVSENRLIVPLFTNTLQQVSTLLDVLTITERILRTPLPLAYNIAISQTVWVFVLLIPFQLTDQFGWVSIPASMVTAYILFGLLHISYEVENPFGYKWNDIDLDRLCRNIAIDLDLISTFPPPADPEKWLYNADNHPLWPLSSGPRFPEMDKGNIQEAREKIEERNQVVLAYWEVGMAKMDERMKYVNAIIHTGPPPPTHISIDSPSSAPAENTSRNSGRNTNIQPEILV